MQKLRDAIYRQKSSLTEVFRSFDVDCDGYISQDEFLMGLAGKSDTVAMTLGDLSDLGISFSDARAIYGSMDEGDRGFVDFSGFSKQLDEPFAPNWEREVITKVHKHLHKQGWTA